MIQFVAWFITITFIGLAIFPITFRFFPKLHDRGYAFSRILGLLLWGIVFWLFSTFQLLPNDLYGAWLAFFVIVIISILCLRKGQWKDLIGWVKKNYKTVITIEVVFLAAFALWSVVRAANPNITATEKPMELAFINAILKSPHFPPNDPWLSGYSISYYYLGYVLIALMIRVTGVTSAVGYNLAGALWFALSAIAAFGIVHNLIHAFVKKADPDSKKAGFSLGGLLGPFFVLIVSNLEGFLEVLYSNGLFWKAGADGTLQSKFWTWLGILDLNTAPSAAPSLIPTRWMWWWRASRVVGQSDLLGNSREIIDEFPFFSYLLADLHPHVLAMPFAMLTIVIGLNFYLKWRQQDLKIFKLREWIRTGEFWLTAVIFGSLGFLNTWDFPIYVAFFAAVFALVRFQQLGDFWKRLWDFIRIILVFIFIGVVLFLPFYISFQSQAGGILPSLEFFTRNVHFWIMFAPLLIPIAIWLLWEVFRKDSRPAFRSGFVFTISVILILFIGSWMMGWVLSSMSGWAQKLQNSTSTFLFSFTQRLSTVGNGFNNIHSLVPQNTLLIGSLVERLKAPGTVLILGILIFLIWSLLGRETKSAEPLTNNTEEKHLLEKQVTHKDRGFLALLVFLGAGLTLIPEFFYLKDQFGWPINTYFKFYFEAWIFWGLAAGIASYILFSKLKNWKFIGFSILWVVLILMSLVYPVLSSYNKTNNFKPSEFTLDGLQYRQQYNSDEEAGIAWLRQATYGVVAEAVGGEYSDYARVSTESGLPTVLGWPGHEIQWRGGNTEIGNRESDIRTVYQNSDWATVETILKQYNIRYIFIGTPELQKYAPDENSMQTMLNKFHNHLALVFQSGSVEIFEYQLNLTPTGNINGQTQ